MSCAVRRKLARPTMWKYYARAISTLATVLAGQLWSKMAEKQPMT